MKTQSILLFFLSLFLLVACSKDEVEPGFSIQTTGDITIAYEAQSQATFILRVHVNGRQLPLMTGSQ